MPVLEELIARAQAYFGEGLKDIVVLHVNHCMDNSFYFSELLNRLFFRAVFVGAPYNENTVGRGWSFPAYYGKRTRQSCQLWREDSCFFQGPMPFMEAVERMIEEALQRDPLPLMESGMGLLGLEAGDYHYPVLGRHLERRPELAAQICGSVEQTASGTARCRAYGREHRFFYPCGSISRSDIKMHLESRFIGHRVVEVLAYFLYSANTFIDFHHILLLGYGIVGRQVALDLQSRSCAVSVWETDGRIAESARKDGHQVVQAVTPELFSADTIVIGSTGAAAFTDEMLNAFFAGSARHLYLASASSQDWEFKRFLEMASGSRPWPEGVSLLERREASCYEQYIFRCPRGTREVFLIAEGLPVNFYPKDGISLTYSVIDLIFAEMLSMGLSFCFGDWKKRLWLLGSSQDFSPFLSERELAALWFSFYHLTGFEQAQGVPESHPQADYLRARVLEGSGKDC